MKRPFLLARVWGSLKAHNGSTCAEVAERTQLKAKTVEGCLQTLRARGSVKYVGHNRHGRWHALGTRPEDRRGMAVASQRNLIPCMEQWEKFVAMAHEARGIPQAQSTTLRVTVTHKYEPHALDMCWSNRVFRNTQSGD